MDIKFDLEEFLVAMRQELNTKIDNVDSKVDGVVSKMAAHDTRLVLLENFRKNAKWVLNTVGGGGGVIGVIDFFRSHWKP